MLQLSIYNRFSRDMPLQFSMQSGLRLVCFQWRIWLNFVQLTLIWRVTQLLWVPFICTHRQNNFSWTILSKRGQRFNEINHVWMLRDSKHFYCTVFLLSFSIISELNKEFPAIWLVKRFLIWRYIPLQAVYITFSRPGYWAHHLCHRGK